MPKLYLVSLFITLIVAPAANVHAQTIVSVGVSDQPGGLALNKQLAQASANDFLAEQASVATFRYDKTDNKTMFERLLKTELRAITLTKSENIGQNGAIVWLSADVTTPRYPDEQCRSTSQTLRNGEQTQGLVLRLLEKTIPDLLRPTLKKSNRLTGVSYLRNLSIDKTWTGALRVKTEVCVAELSPL